MLKENKWLKRIFSIEFAALCVALTGVYFGYVPIKSYFFDEDNIVATFNNTEIKLSKDKENADTIKIIAYSYNMRSFPTVSLMTLNNTSNHVIKGLNVRTNFVTENTTGLISTGWRFIERGESGSMCYNGNELPPFGIINFPFENIGNVNPDESHHVFLMTTSVAYEGAEKEKFISLLIYINDIDVSDIFNKRYGNGTPPENRTGFNNDFINKCVDITFNHYYNQNPELLAPFYVYINTFDKPTILSMNEIVDRYKTIQK